MQIPVFDILLKYSGLHLGLNEHSSILDLFRCLLHDYAGDTICLIEGMGEVQ